MAPEMPAMDMMTANWMASILAMQQAGMMPMPGFGGYPAFPEAFPGVFDPSLMGFPAAAALPVPDLPVNGKAQLHVDTEIKGDAAVESSPLGDLSNVLAAALEGKSPTKSRPSPAGSPERMRNTRENENGVNGQTFGPFSNDMKSAMKEAGIASMMNAAFPPAA
jgi:hypothetical protein